MTRLSIGFDQCALCAGSGDCLSCDGTGLAGGTIAAAACGECGGSGTCIDCDGSGDKDEWDGT